MIPKDVSARVTLAWAIAGIAAAAWYFTWLLQPERPGVMALFVLLIAADAFNGFHALTFWATCLRGSRRRRFLSPDRARVDVFIPTLDEPERILLRTVRAARAMRGADVRVFLLDDGGRWEVSALASYLGVEYIARSDSAGAKAGNINNALRVTRDGGAEYVAVFDADHAPRPAFLERTLGYFVDRRIALVQTPQVYGNAAEGPIPRAAAEQQAIFFGPICRGRDGWDAAFCCGTNFVALREALDDVGGFPEDSVTEDIALSITLKRRGWGIAYESSPLAVGLGPEDARSYLSQQHRWARGCLELLLRRPWRLVGLGPVGMWQYFAATSYWLTGWTVIVYLSLPVARMLFGAPVITDPAGEFAVHFLPYFLIAVVSLGRFTAGRYTLHGVAANWGCFAVHIRATLDVIRGRSTGFAVTSKTALEGVPWRLIAPNLVAVAVLAGASAIALAGAVSPAVMANVSFAVLACALVGAMACFAIVQSRMAAGPDEPDEPRMERSRRFAPAHAVAQAGAGVEVGR